MNWKYLRIKFINEFGKCNLFIGIVYALIFIGIYSNLQWFVEKLF